MINVCEHEYSYALPDRIGANPYDPYLTMQDIRTAKQNAEYVIVIYHGGKELCRYPSPRLRNLCREMVYCGADVVLTQHSHCIGCYEEFEKGHILYGQGNFHFCAPGKTDLWNTGLLVELDIEKDLKIRFIPIVTGELGIDLAQGQKYDEIMRSFAERNEELENGKWLDGWKAYCAGASKWYKEVISESLISSDFDIKEQRFAHYLDCEAHTDILREIYPTWNQTNEK